MLTIRCTFLRGVFEGGDWDDPRSPEWPPSWMRLFSALVSVADAGSDDDGLLRRLEAVPPEILASEVAPTSRVAFVPTNAILKETRHTTLLARTNGERMWARSAPRSPDVWYRWVDLELTDKEQRRLEAVCRRVPYLGRSTSPVVVSRSDNFPEGEWLVPRDSVKAGAPFQFQASVRSPHAGALDVLREIHEATYVQGKPRDPWQVGLGLDYGRVLPDETPPEASGPYPTLIVLALEGRGLDGRHTGRVAYAFRRALLSRASEHLPTLHGHHDGEVVQCAFLGLPDVAHKHANGHLLGLAVAVPDLPSEQLAVIADALPDLDEVMEVNAGPLGRLAFRRIAPVTAQRRARGLRSDRWVRPRRRWATATPIVLDRFPKRRNDLDAHVKAATVNSRLPEPRILVISRHPVVTGGPALSPRDTLRRPEDRAFKPFRYVMLEFPVPVNGPVVIGAMRHYGLGLCVPLKETSDG